MKIIFILRKLIRYTSCNRLNYAGGIYIITLKHGLRGSAFEEMINITHEAYAKEELAIIQKVPTPITPIEVDNKAHIITKAYFGEKSTVDYIGVVQGIAVCFDAKETQYKNLPLKNIHAHQLEFMQSFNAQKGLAFLLVHFKFSGEIFLMPIARLARHYFSGARKSIPYADFDRELLVPSAGKFPVHYLETLNILLANSKFM